MSDRKTEQLANSTLDDIVIDTGHVERAGDCSDSAQAGPENFEFSSFSDSEAPTPCAFITGRAGTGKTFTIRERCASDPDYAMLSSSTGISAINLNTVTVHSLLGFFDLDSLRDAYIHGTARRKLQKIADEGYRNVVIDECSMIGRETLDLVVRIFDEVNLDRKEKGALPIGLILLGDFGQLPAIGDKPGGGGGYGQSNSSSSSSPRGRRAAVPTPWCFESQFWDRFAANEVRLTKVWRQADPRFLAALDFARSGKGRECLEVLRGVGQRFESGVDMMFRGTTIVGKNDEVDRINHLRLDQEKGRLIALPSRRWAVGKGGAVGARAEWKHIPERTLVKEGSYVMILANQYNADGEMVYANGDCGWVRGIEAGARVGVGAAGNGREGTVESATAIGAMPTVMVELARTGEVVHVGSLIRDVAAGEPAGWIDEWDESAIENGKDGIMKYLSRPHVKVVRKRKQYVTGQLQYYPLRLCYATTLHKAQGLSMDACQIDIRSWMMKSPAMIYTALSRCRTLEGLRIVGTPELFVDRCRMDAKVARWL